MFIIAQTIAGGMPGALQPCALVLLLLAAGAQAAWYDGLVAGLKVPPGFEVSVYAEVPAARSLAKSDSGVVFVGARPFLRPSAALG